MRAKSEDTGCAVRKKGAAKEGEDSDGARGRREDRRTRRGGERGAWRGEGGATVGGRRGAHRDKEREQRRGVRNTQESGDAHRARVERGRRGVQRVAQQSNVAEGRGGDTRTGGAKGERASEAQAHAAGGAVDGRRSTLNRRKEGAADAAEDDEQTGKDAQRERWRGGSKGEGAAGEKRAKERAAA